MSPSHISLAVLSSALFGLNVVVSKLGVEHFPPLLFAALRFLCVLPLVFFFPKPKLSLGALSVIALGWGVFYIGGINMSLAMGLSAGTAVLLIRLSNFLTILLGIYVFSKKPSLNEMMGLGVGLSGILLVCSSLGLQANLAAILVLLCATAMYSIGTIVAKKAGSSALSTNIWVALLSFLPTLLLSYLFEGNNFELITSADLKAWGTVLFAGLGSSFLGGVLWIYLLGKCDLSSVMPFRLLVPIFGVSFAAILLNELPSLEIIVGGTLVIGGLILTQLKAPLLSLVTKKRKKYG